MDGKTYDINEYVELFNRLYDENERRKDSVNFYKPQLKKVDTLYANMVDTANKYIDELYFYQTKYENLREYLEKGKILYMKGDTLKVKDRKEYLKELKQ